MTWGHVQIQLRRAMGDIIRSFRFMTSGRVYTRANISVSAVHWRYGNSFFFFFSFASRWHLCQIFSPEPTNTKGILPHFNDSREGGPVEDGVLLKDWLDELLLLPESVMVRSMRVRNTRTKNAHRTRSLTGQIRGRSWQQSTTTEKESTRNTTIIKMIEMERSRTWIEEIRYTYLFSKSCFLPIFVLTPCVQSTDLAVLIVTWLNRLLIYLLQSS